MNDGWRQPRDENWQKRDEAILATRPLDGDTAWGSSGSEGKPRKSRSERSADQRRAAERLVRLCRSSNHDKIVAEIRILELEAEVRQLQLALSSCQCGAVQA